MVRINSDKVTADSWANRLLEVREDEIKNGIVDENGKGISVGISSRNWEFARLVLYGTLKKTDVEMAIKKICYVVQEYDKLLA